MSRLSVFYRLLAAAAALGLGIGSAQARLVQSLRLPLGSAEAELGEQMRLYGQALDVRVFDAPVALPEVLRQFSLQQPGLADLTVLPGQAILSGMVRGQLLTVTLESPQAGRTIGSIAALIFPSAGAVSSIAPVWMPEGARLRFDFSLREGAKRVSQQIWSHRLPLVRLQVALRQALQRCGWVSGQAVRNGATWHWVRGASALQLHLLELDEGSGILLLREDAP